jgi:hypothetical protein
MRFLFILFIVTLSALAFGAERIVILEELTSAT